MFVTQFSRGTKPFRLTTNNLFLAGFQKWAINHFIKMFYQSCLYKTNLRSKRFIQDEILLDPNCLNFHPPFESAFIYLVSNLGLAIVVATWPETTLSRCAFEEQFNGCCDESLNLHQLCCLKMRRWGCNSRVEKKIWNEWVIELLLWTVFAC